jgi:hypothetical protein
MVMRVCPERKPALPNAPENFVKLHIAHQKGVMLRRNISISVGEVQSDLIIRLHRKEWSKGGWRRKPENFNKKSCGRALVVRVDDGMVKFNAHTRDSSYENSFRYSISQSQNIRKGRAMGRRTDERGASGACGFDWRGIGEFVGCRALSLGSSSQVQSIKQIIFP